MRGSYRIQATWTPARPPGSVAEGLAGLLATSGMGDRELASSSLTCWRMSPSRQLARSMLKPFLTTIRSTAVSCRLAGKV